MRLQMDLEDRALRRLKLSDLRLFHAVVQRGGMAKAAVQLNISQPAVSKAIAALEYTLGVRLLERHPQGVEPTVYGRALVKGGMAAFDELKQSVKQIEFLADPTAGELRIGCSEPLASGFVAAVIERLVRQYPRVVFHVVAADPVTLVEHELRQRNIDLMIAPTSRIDSHPELDIELLFDDRQVVMAGSKNEWLRRRKIALADLVDAPWMLPPPDSIIGSSILEVFRANGLKPPRGHVVSFSIPLCCQLLAGGRFLAMLPVSMACVAKGLALRILDVKFAGIPRPTGIMTLKRRTPTPLAQHFVRVVREVAKPLASRK
jgi:DNA-binding transcriptional LysR family regulator